MLARLSRPGLRFAQADGDVIAQPPNGTAEARLAIYIHAYWQRLIDCLKDDYPGLLELLGVELFATFGRAYIERHPSRSPSLYELGAEFPAFLRQSQRGRLPHEMSVKQRHLPLDLARYERSRVEILRARGLEGSSLRVPLSHPEAELKLPDTTRLMLSRHSVAELDVYCNHAAPVAPDEHPQHYLVIARRGFGITARGVEDWAFFALYAARLRPRSMHACARFAARRTRQPVGVVLARLLLWVPLMQAMDVLV
jgi:hypothetical protein